MRINSELMGAQLENLGSDLTPASTDKGRIGYRSTTTPIQVSDGTTNHRVLTDQMAGDIADLVEDLVEIGHAQVTTVNYAISSSDSDTFSTSSTSFTDVTNLSVSITTTGKPVQIMLIPGDTSNASKVTVSRSGSVFTYATLKAVRGATDLASLDFGNGDSVSVLTWTPVSSFQWIDTPAAGTYTYKIQVKVDSASAVAQVLQAKLYVKEL